MLRRHLLARSLLLPPIGAAAACAPAAPPARRRVRLRLLAPPDLGRQAKLAAWNRRHGEGTGTLLELAPPAGAPGADEALGVLAALLAADPQPAQLIWVDHRDVPGAALRGRLRPLGDLARRDRYDLKRFMPPALQPGYGPDERLYALPEEVEARQLYFNRQHLAEAGIDFRKAGLDFERPAHTWAAFRQVGLDLVAAPRGRERLPFHAAHEGAPLELWGWQNGGEWLAEGGRRATFDRPENVAALAWLGAHARELGGPERLAAVGPFPAPARAGGEADEPGSHPFLTGRVSLCFESTRFASTVAGWRPAFPLGYVEPPRRHGAAPLVSWCRSWGYALGRDAPDGAWDGLRFLLSEDGAVVAAAAAAEQAPLAGPVPDAAPAGAPIPGRALWYPPYSGQLALDTRLAAAYQTGVKLVDEARDHGLEQLRHARFPPPCPVPREVWPRLAEARRLAILAGAPPAEALAAAQRQAQAQLDAAWAAHRR